MELFKAKLLKDLSYITGCELRRGEIVFMKKLPDRTNWVIDHKSNSTIKLFTHEFEII